MNGKILILSNSDAGLYEFRKEVVSALVSENYEVHISVPDTGYVSRLEALGARMYPTALDRRGMNPAKDIKLFSEYRKLIKSIKPLAVLTYTIKPNVYGGVACRTLKVPCIANVTGLGSTLQGDGLVKKVIVQMYKAGLKGASCVFFQNSYNMEFMRETGCISADKHTRLLAGSGVNLEEHCFQEYPENDKEIHLLNIGRIMDDKGSAELLSAAEQIHEKYPNVVFDILGSYEEETKEKYEPWVKRLEEKGVLKFHGFRDDVDIFYGKSHALVHPSFHEGMSNVVLEAAAAGRPVLTSDIPGCKEIYENGIGGIAFSPKDEKALYEAIEKFLELDESAKAQMGCSARKYVEKKFDRKLVIEAYLDEIKTIGG